MKYLYDDANNQPKPHFIFILATPFKSTQDTTKTTKENNATDSAQHTTSANIIPI